MNQITKRHNHDHFWIHDEILYESYRTIRGLRYSEVSEAKGLNDKDRCTEEEIKLIEKQWVK